MADSQAPKPTREELKQRLAMAKMRGSLARMPKKHREAKVEQLQKKAQEEQAKMMEAFKAQLTPEQRAQMGIPADAKVDVRMAEASQANPTTIPRMQPVNESSQMMDV